MKKGYCNLYAPTEAITQMANVTPEQIEEGMKLWFA